MSKFANKFLSTLNEEIEKEGNAFSKKVATTPKGGKFEINGKEVKDTSDYDSKVSEDKQLKLKMGEKKAKQLKLNLKSEALIQGVMSAEAEDPAPAPAPEVDDSEAWKQSLDKSTDPKDFDVADNPQLGVDSSGITAAHEWIQKLVEMAEFVNGTGPESLNSQINQLELKNSVPFRGVVRREEKRITKLAENLRGLAEVLKSVVITSEKKVKDATSPR
jgi:hypothetical protein